MNFFLKKAVLFGIPLLATSSCYAGIGNKYLHSAIYESSDHSTMLIFADNGTAELISKDIYDARTGNKQIPRNKLSQFQKTSGNCYSGYWISVLFASRPIEIDGKTCGSFSMRVNECLEKTRTSNSECRVMRIYALRIDDHECINNKNIWMSCASYEYTLDILRGVIEFKLPVRNEQRMPFLPVGDVLELR